MDDIENNSTNDPFEMDYDISTNNKFQLLGDIDNQQKQFGTYIIKKPPGIIINSEQSIIKDWLKKTNSNLYKKIWQSE